MDRAAKLDVELANERDPDERGPRDASGDSPRDSMDIRDGMLREEIIRPFHRCIDRK